MSERERINLDRQQEDLHPGFALLKGDFRDLRKIASNAREATILLDGFKIGFNERGHKVAYVKQELQHEGMSTFLQAQDFGGVTYLTGLIKILRDAGYQKDDISKTLTDLNKIDRGVGVSDEKIVQLIESFFAERNET